MVAAGACGPTPRFYLGLFAAGAVWRLLISWWTPIPTEDGANYLWMAEQFAQANAAAALSEVFPPLLPMLVSVPVGLGCDPFRAGQVVLALAGALAVVFLARGAEAILPGGGRCAGCFALFAPLPVRLGAEVHSEPLFLLLAAVAVELGLRRRAWAMGCLAGLAFWVRSEEAVVLVAAFFLAAPRRAWRAWLPLAVAVVALGVWRERCGLGFDPLPKIAFNLERTVAGTDLGGGLGQLGANALAIPGLWLEAFGVVGVLAWWGLARGSRRGMAPLYWACGLGVLMMCVFLARRRFLVSWLIAVSPIALAGFQALPSRWRAPVFWLVLVSSILLNARVMDANRSAERMVGEYLATRIEPGQVVAGDMTRVIYFAGSRPLPPRHFTVEQLAARARKPEVQFVVLGARRPTAEPVATALAAEFTEHELPPALAAAAADRGIRVLSRR